MTDVETVIKLPNKKIEAILNDPKKAAEAVDLLYVQDSQPGITRRKQAGKFFYFAGKKKITDKKTLDRIAKLVVPPAWDNVWICSHANGHLQATGIDARGRKQYRYHSLWNSLRNQTKFYRLYEFGRAIPHIREQLDKDLSLHGFPVEKVLALVVCLMDQTSMRIGNSAYEKLYGSYGLTTLKNSHVQVNGSKMQFIFKGKKGICQSVSHSNKRLARLVKQCRDIPGKELFQYYDEDGNHRSIDSGMVNDYIKNIAEQDFTAKDFRTWSGTVHALEAFVEMVSDENKKDPKKNVIEVIDKVSAHLGNTRAVCKKYYIHPVVFDLYEKDSLQKYLLKFAGKNKNVKKSLNKSNQGLGRQGLGRQGLGRQGLSREEKLLMSILKNESLIC